MTMTRRTALFAPALLAILALFSLAPAHAAKPEIYVKQGGVFSAGWEHALGGYDTVAYHTQGKPVKGDPQFSTEYKGATWIFASQENLDTFLADPDAYRPQYGGYCAYALAAKGQLIHGDPLAWHIDNGKLYVNYDKGTQKRWLQDKAGYIEKADAQWPAILEK